ncbi:MAG: GDP-mannose pyrophosphatase NudK [Flavobacteriaceae bacterium]|nr:GDP-mannose pyrophosphatase NudK [Flavobacteriaceae bacterium]
MSKSIQIIQTEILSNQWYVLRKITYQHSKNDGTLQTQSREVYDRGNGAAILLYHLPTRNVILTRQFRLPTYVNGNADGMMIEVCAGLLDEDHPDDCIKKETLEETGYLISDVIKVMEAYMSPGAVTEIIHFYVAAYTPEMKIGVGGGLEQEGEDIEVMEIHLDEAMKMVETGVIKDAKTILLLQYVALHVLK